MYARRGSAYSDAVAGAVLDYLGFVDLHFFQQRGNDAVSFAVYGVKGVPDFIVGGFGFGQNFDRGDELVFAVDVHPGCF